MIERLLPPGVVGVDCFGDPPEAVLLPAEEAVAHRFGRRRRAEFTSVRHCARTAMVSLGHPPGPVLPGPDRAPRWPAQIVGSLTHCRGYRAAALAPAGRFLGLGIDADLNQALPGGALVVIGAAGEERHLSRLPDLGVHWDKLLLSAKESVYKVWQPLTGLGLDPIEARIEFGPADGSFSARVLLPAGVGPEAPRQLSGRWLAQGHLLATAVVARRAD